MDITIIIPNWNGKNLLAKNLPAVLKALDRYKGRRKELIVVDDYSTDDSVSFLDTFIGIKVITLKNHSGFITAANRGVKEAKGEIVILLNNDVSPEENFISPLIENFKDPKVFAVGCLEKSTQSGKEILSGKSTGYFKKGLIWHDRAKDQLTPGSTFWVAGGSGAFRKSIWEVLDGLDPLFEPFYWEDIDLSYRAQKEGYKVLFEPKSIVFHNHETTIGKAFIEKEIKIISIKNQILFIWKNISDINFLIKHLLWFPYHIAKSLMQCDFTFVTGLKKAINQLPQLLKQRKIASKSWTKKDAEIL